MCGRTVAILFGLFGLDKETRMLIMRVSLSSFSLPHARGQRTIARAPALHIEDDRRYVAKEGSFYYGRDIAEAEERKQGDRNSDGY